MLSGVYTNRRVVIYYYIGILSNRIMARSQVNIRVPDNIGREIKRYQNKEGLEHQSEAVRQLLHAGVEAQKESGPGERLAESATAISGVGSLVALVAAAFGATWAWGVLMPFLTATLLFALLLASIRVAAGKDLA